MSLFLALLLALLLAQSAPASAQDAEASDEDGPQLRTDLEVAGEARLLTPDTGQSRQLRLARGRLQLALRQVGPASARVALEPVRSGGDTGYIGIAGESIVPRVQIAEVRGDWALAGRLSVSGGLVDDPWVVAGQRAWDLTSVAPTLSYEQDWLDRSDLGGWLGWRAPRRFVELRVAALTGEGLAGRESNDGWNLTGWVDLRPLAGLDLGAVDGAELLSIQLFGRDGSQGIGLARDHRVGARVHAAHDWVAGGAEYVMGWGLDGDASLLPGGFSAWLTTGSGIPAVGWARLDMAQADRTDADTRVTTWRVGGGPALGPREQRRALFCVFGVEGLRYGPDAAPLPGSGSASNSTAFFIQLGSELSAATAVDLL